MCGPDVVKVVRVNNVPTFFLTDSGCLFVDNLLVLTTKVGVEQITIFVDAGQTIVVYHLNGTRVRIGVAEETVSLLHGVALVKLNDYSLEVVIDHESMILEELILPTFRNL